MKQIIPNGPRIKELRLGLEKYSTQKEVAHAVRVSERKLRQIENESATISLAGFVRLTWQARPVGSMTSG